eukprot:TRINITY_DN6029_c0_g3_i1.p1 TRINITY_DN6029_c0_g3~~TRINITY_DN6029_c0_g3_i1.p1  ORF type:complete len:301 (+),score=72.94 TRINITY_DN6029_c0_g3_i1:437-1339(+)
MPDTILYVNICYTDSVIPPLKDNNELADPKDDSTWKLIPFSITKAVAIPSKDIKKIAADMDVSKVVHDVFMEKPTSRKAIADYLLRVVQKEFAAQYRVLLKSSKILKKRRYRGADLKQDKPTEHELAPKADFDLYKKAKEREAEESSKPRVEEKKTEQKSNLTKIEYKTPLELDKEFTLARPEAKLSPQIVELPSYEIKKLEDKLRVTVSLPSVSEMSEVELLVSDNCVKVLPRGQQEISIPLKQVVDKSKVAAKFNKKKKILTISLAICVIIHPSCLAFFRGFGAVSYTHLTLPTICSV